MAFCQDITEVLNFTASYGIAFGLISYVFIKIFTG